MERNRAESHREPYKENRGVHPFGEGLKLSLGVAVLYYEQKVDGKEQTVSGEIGEIWKSWNTYVPLHHKKITYL